MANVNRMFNRMRMYYEMIKGIRLDILRKGAYDPVCPKGLGRGKRVLKPNIGDIIMVCNPDKHNDAKYGIVEGLKSDPSLIIRFRGDSKGTSVPTRLGMYVQFILIILRGITCSPSKKDGGDFL